MEKLKRETEKIKWTQRSKPGKIRRNRRLNLSVTPITADRLATLAQMDGVSVTHAIELMTDAEYSRRLDDKTKAKIMRAIEKMHKAGKETFTAAEVASAADAGDSSRDDKIHEVLNRAIEKIRNTTAEIKTGKGKAGKGKAGKGATLKAQPSKGAK